MTLELAPKPVMQELTIRLAVPRGATREHLALLLDRDEMEVVEILEKVSTAERTEEGFVYHYDGFPAFDRDTETLVLGRVVIDTRKRKHWKVEFVREYEWGPEEWNKCHGF